ncbi:MAG: AAC(3) family N-acetyltransferase [Kiritimatiellae bacterium]|nr:AAC(3) family N-acetyltransferase [Kiritimatiellia bacterium]
MADMSFNFRALSPLPQDGFTAKALTEAQFLAGEDARGTIVVLEPETPAGAVQVAAFTARGVLGFVSDFTPDRFERPDEIPAFTVGGEPGGLAVLAVSPRSGVRLRTLAAGGALKIRLESSGGSEGTLAAIVPELPQKRDRSGDPTVGKDEILAALAAVGVRRGDTLLVHSALSACGRIEGGAKTILDAIIETIGPEGNFFVPTFQRSECFLNGISKRWDHRPSDFRDRASEAVRWVGTLPLEFMRLWPDAPRGVHISHSWAGLGPRAAEVLSRQVEDEAPFSDNSCPMVVKDMGGKILLFGSSIGRVSFVHCFETHYGLPGRGPSYYDVRLADGSITWKFVPDAVPGPREFYTRAENARFFREAVRRGLEIRRERLGVGELKLMDCRSFWDIGSEIVKEDPGVIIGDL